MIKKIKNSKLFKNKIFQLVLFAFLINFVCDIFIQRSFIDAFVRIFTKPLNVLFNMALICLTISLCGLFKRQKFALIMLSFPWLGIAIGNFVLQFYRSAPLAFVDLQLIFYVQSVFNSYLSIFDVILIVLAVVALAILFVIVFKKCKKNDRFVFKSLSYFAVSLLFVLIFKGPFVRINALSDDYDNLTIAYKEYGFPYCFVNSMIDRDVHEPDKYSSEDIRDCIVRLDDFILNKNYENVNVSVDSDDAPNVIFLQLESFMDCNYLLDIDFSSNPNPFFSSLKESYPHGSLAVPTYGAGTANVEFEVMTGLSLDYFGPGEYPYMTVLRDQTSESVCFNLKEHNYYSTIIHNNRASFYDRDNVFANMGYDRYVSSEFMVDLEYTPVGWIKDKCLEYEIFKALEKSPGKDFIYTISVEGHGQYIGSTEGLSSDIKASSSDLSYSEDLLNQYAYYANLVYEMDLFIKSLVSSLEEYDENVMLVIFGDHLPNLAMSDEDVYFNDVYMSEYVIYTNYEADIESKDLATYQLASYALENIACNTGIINKLHQTREFNNNYKDDLHMLEYDIFENHKYLWGGSNPYIREDMEFGYNDLIINSVSYNEGVITIKGENFNECTRVYINKSKEDCVLIDKNTLIVYNDEVDDGDIILLKQMNGGTVYSISNSLEIKK